MGYRVVDTFPSFIEYWRKVGHKDVDHQLEEWEKQYMSKYPELFKLQVENYEGMGLDWRKIAKERVLPNLPKLFPEIRKAWCNLREVIPRAYKKFKDFWKRDFNIVFVIYVGTGCGAGWATAYSNHYAVLFGLENIAELKWHTRRSLEGLTIHELSHIAHMVLRGLMPKDFERLEEDPLFLLYSEGFATRCEHLILGGEEWRMASNKSWLQWCERNIRYLALKYLERVAESRSVNDFYGSWLNIDGVSQTGYYLGCQYIKHLERTRTIEEIAKMSVEEVKTTALGWLEQLAM